MKDKTTELKLTPIPHTSCAGLGLHPFLDFLMANGRRPTMGQCDGGANSPRNSPRAEPEAEIGRR